MIYLNMQARFNIMNKLIHQTKPDTFGLQTYLENVFTLVIFYFPLLLSQKHYSWILKPNEMNWEGQKKLNDQNQKWVYQCSLHPVIKTTFENIWYRTTTKPKNPHLNGLYYVSYLF